MEAFTKPGAMDDFDEKSMESPDGMMDMMKKLGGKKMMKQMAKGKR
jgi:hypothetical protein